WSVGDFGSECAVWRQRAVDQRRSGDLEVVRRWLQHRERRADAEKCHCRADLARACGSEATRKESMKRSRALAASIGIALMPCQALAATVTARANAPAPVGTPIEFTAEGAGTGELTYTWNFGDGQKSQPSASATVTHTYETPGHYPLILAVQDATGARRARPRRALPR